MFPSFHAFARHHFKGLCAGTTLAAYLLAPGTSMAAGGISGYVVAPLSLMDRANQATIRVSLNGKTTSLVLDTGASVTVLDEHFYQGVHAGAADVKQEELPSGMQKKVSANGERAEIGYIDSLLIGSVNFGKKPVLVTNLSLNFGRYNARHPGEAVAGLLGEDFLRKYSAIIDWARRGVYLNTEPSKRIKMGSGMTAAGWTAVPMATTNAHHFTVQANVSGKPVRLIVDTGAQFTTFAPGIVPLEMMYNRDNGGSIGHLASNASTMSMIGGNTTMYPARVEHWKIGSYEIASSIVAVNQFPQKLLVQESAGEGPVLGLLGSEVLAKNHAIIDIAGSTLYLKPK